jgi:hypothetical protein
MKHFQPSSFPATPQAGFYDVTSCVGGIIRNTSLLLLMLWYAFAAAAAAVDTAKSVWHHPSVRSFVTALKADLSDKSSLQATAPALQRPGEGPAGREQGAPKTCHRTEAG